jgi:GNAT superfamily N-acetyltransferase
MHIAIRAFSDNDLNTADAILQAAFQRPGSWLKELGIIRNLQPAGAFLAHNRETTAGVVFTLMYPGFTYVGPLGVHPDFQHQGIGFALMEHILEWLGGQGVTQIALDASPMGQSIYERLGFVAFEQVNIFQRPSGEQTSQPPPEVQQLSLQNLDLITATDKQTFGTDRSRLLSALLEVYPQRGFFLTDAQGFINGYLIAQERSIGPWVATNKADADLLLKAALSLFSQPVSVVVPEENTNAAALLGQFGFERVRVLRHMVKGSKEPAGQREKVYGQTSPSLG